MTMLLCSGKSRAVLLIIAVFIFFLFEGLGVERCREDGEIIAVRRKSDERFAKPSPRRKALELWVELMDEFPQPFQGCVNNMVA
jgi:hypothetical protein